MRRPDDDKEMMRVQLPSGAHATVARDVSPETLDALDEMARAAARALYFPCPTCGTRYPTKGQAWNCWFFRH